MFATLNANRVSCSTVARLIRKPLLSAVVMFIGLAVLSPIVETTMGEKFGNCCGS